jgi:hypothetical protein
MMLFVTNNNITVGGPVAVPFTTHRIDVDIIRRLLTSVLTLELFPGFFIIYYYYLVCEAIGTAAAPDLLCQPRVIVKMIVEKQTECRLAEETEVLGDNLPQRYFCPSQNPT